MTNTSGPNEVLSQRRAQAAITVDLLSDDLRTALRVRAAEVGLTYGAYVRVLVSEHLDAVKGVSADHEYRGRERERFLAHRSPEAARYPEDA